MFMSIKAAALFEAVSADGGLRDSIALCFPGTAWGTLCHSNLAMLQLAE